VELRLFVEPQQGASYEQQRAMARVAEQSGFGAFFRSDHYLRIGDGDPRPGPTDSWVTLAGLARETTRIRLGTLVTSATFRRPGPLAIAVAQVDAMSGGRVELGIGAGWYDAEHVAYAIPFGTFSERFAHLTEQLEVLTGLWTTPEGETFDYDGRLYQVHDSPALPKPVQRPHPPIILGGAGPKRTPALAARFADEFNVPFHSVADAARQIDVVRAACETAGRDPASLTYSVAVSPICGTDDADVARRAEAAGRTVEHARLAGPTGTPSEVVEQLQAYADVGATRAYLQLLDITDLDHARLIGAEVLPQLA
jgi:F420-dependent oxidoreductase-like protein